MMRTRDYRFVTANKRGCYILFIIRCAINLPMTKKGKLRLIYSHEFVHHLESDHSRTVFFLKYILAARDRSLLHYCFMVPSADVFAVGLRTNQSRKLIVSIATQFKERTMLSLAVNVIINSLLNLFFNSIYF